MLIKVVHKCLALVVCSDLEINIMCLRIFSYFCFSFLSARWVQMITRCFWNWMWSRTFLQVSLKRHCCLRKSTKHASKGHFKIYKQVLYLDVISQILLCLMKMWKCFQDHHQLKVIPMCLRSVFPLSPWVCKPSACLFAHVISNVFFSIFKG